jgi:hypothetical protein
MPDARKGEERALLDELHANATANTLKYKYLPNMASK